MSLTALVPITREEPRVSPEELPKCEPQAGAGCWQQSARPWRWKERTSVSRTSPPQPPQPVLQLPQPVPQPTERLWPLTLPACRSSATGSQPIWLSRTPRTRQGGQSFRSRWMMSSTTQLAAAEVARVAACWVCFLLGFAEKYELSSSFCLGQSKIFFFFLPELPSCRGVSESPNQSSSLAPTLCFQSCLPSPSMGTPHPHLPSKTRPAFPQRNISAVLSPATKTQGRVWPQCQHQVNSPSYCLCQTAPACTLRGEFGDARGAPSSLLTYSM